jgi:tetratricopeptide (TPR) repeat protein
MRVQFKLAVLFLFLGMFAFVPATSPQQKSSKQPAKRPTVRVEDPQQALLAQAEAAIEKKDFPRAIEALQKYLAEKPADAYAHFQLAFALDRMAKYDEAIAEYKRAIELDAKMAAAYQNLSALLVKSNPAEALPLLATAAQLQPENVEVTFLRGIAEEGLDHETQAVEYFRQAARARPDNSQFRLVYARKLLQLGRAAEAEPEFRAAVALRDESPEALLGLADCLLAQQKSAQAISPLRKYLALQPGDNESRVQLARLLFESEKFEDAEAELSRAEAAGVASLSAMKLRASLLIHEQRFDDAIAVAIKIVAAEPNDAEWHARLGRLHLEKRDFPAAEHELLEALRLDDKLTDAVRDLGAVYYLGEKYEAALRWQDELARRETPGEGWWFIRATCYDKLHKIPEAIAAYEKFLALDAGRSQKQGFQSRERLKVLKRELERSKH